MISFECFQVLESLQRIRERKLVNFIEWGPASIQVCLITTIGFKSLIAYFTGDNIDSFMDNWAILGVINLYWVKCEKLKNS